MFYITILQSTRIYSLTGFRVKSPFALFSVSMFKNLYPEAALDFPGNKLLKSHVLRFQVTNICHFQAEPFSATLTSVIKIISQRKNVVESLYWKPRWIPSVEQLFNFDKIRNNEEAKESKKDKTVIESVKEILLKDSYLSSLMSVSAFTKRLL